MLEYIATHWLYILRLTGQHIYIVLISISFSIISGVLSGILVSRLRRNIGKILTSIAGFIQAIPSIGMIALIFIYTGIGARTAIIALSLYCIIPIFFNTTSALLSVPADLKESAAGMGMTPSQILFKLEIPVALPSIFAGIRTASTINIATATVATVIGAGGLGDIIFVGLRVLKPEMIFTGAIIVSLLAIIFDYIIFLIEKRVVSKGLTEKI